MDISVSVTFQFHWHLSFSDILDSVTFQFPWHFTLSDISVVVTYQFQWQFSFSDILVSMLYRVLFLKLPQYQKSCCIKVQYSTIQKSMVHSIPRWKKSTVQQSPVQYGTMQYNPPEQNALKCNCAQCNCLNGVHTDCELRQGIKWGCFGKINSQLNIATGINIGRNKPGYDSIYWNI